MEVNDKVRINIAEVRAMQFDGKIDDVLEKILVDSIITYYRKQNSIENEDFDEIIAELYGIDNYMEEHY